MGVAPVVEWRLQVQAELQHGKAHQADTSRQGSCPELLPSFGERRRDKSTGRYLAKERYSPVASA